MMHQAILNLYQAASVSEFEDGSLVVLDAQGNSIEIDEAAVAVEAERLAQVAVTQARIAELKAFLRDTDYVALSDYDKDKPEIIAERQAAREELRELGA
jgi:hypothetical protein